MLRTKEVTKKLTASGKKAAAAKRRRDTRVSNAITSVKKAKRKSPSGGQAPEGHSCVRRNYSRFAFLTQREASLCLPRGAPPMAGEQGVRPVALVAPHLHAFYLPLPLACSNEADYHPGPYHFCMADAWELPLALTNKVRDFAAAHASRQQAEKDDTQPFDPVPLPEAATVVKRWKDIQNRRNRAKLPLLAALRARISTQSTDASAEYTLADYLYNMVIMDGEMSLRVLWNEHPPPATNEAAVDKYLDKYWFKVEDGHKKRSDEVSSMLRTKEVTKKLTASGKKAAAAKRRRDTRVSNAITSVKKAKRKSPSGGQAPEGHSCVRRNYSRFAFLTQREASLCLPRGAPPMAGEQGVRPGQVWNPKSAIICCGSGRSGAYFISPGIEGEARGQEIPLEEGVVQFLVVLAGVVAHHLPDVGVQLGRLRRTVQDSEDGGHVGPG